MQIKALIEQITNELINHWNNRDMDKFENYLSENVVVRSPNISKLYPENTECVLRKKEAVLQYWKRFNSEYFFEMKLVVLNKNDKIINCELNVYPRGDKLYVKFVIDEYGKFCEMEVRYYK